MRFSWSYLFTQYGYGDNQDGGTGLKSYPLDYVYSGNYNWNNGRLYSQGVDAYLWSSTIGSSAAAYRLATWSTGVHPAESDTKALGRALRCVKHTNNLKVADAREQKHFVKTMI